MDVTIEGATGSLIVSNTLVSLGELDLQSPNFQFDDVDGADGPAGISATLDSLVEEYREIWKHEEVLPMRLDEALPEHLLE